MAGGLITCERKCWRDRSGVDEQIHDTLFYVFMDHSGGHFHWEVYDKRGAWGNTPKPRWITGGDLAMPLESLPRVCASWDTWAQDAGTLGSPTAQTLALSLLLDIYVINTKGLLCALSWCLPSPISGLAVFVTSAGRMFSTALRDTEPKHCTRTSVSELHKLLQNAGASIADSTDR